MGTNNNYKRGAAFERKIVDALRAKGYFAARSAGSHGMADVVALAPYGEHGMARAILIQCKTGKARMSGKDRKAFAEQARRHGASAYELTPDTMTLIEGSDILTTYSILKELYG